MFTASVSVRVSLAGRRRAGAWALHRAGRQHVRAAPPFHTLAQPLPTFTIALAARCRETREALTFCVSLAAH